MIRKAISLFSIRKKIQEQEDPRYSEDFYENGFTKESLIRIRYHNLIKIGQKDIVARVKIAKDRSSVLQTKNKDVRPLLPDEKFLRSIATDISLLQVMKAYERITSSLIIKSRKVSQEYFSQKENLITSFIDSDNGRFICWNVISLSEAFENVYLDVHDISVRSIVNNLQFFENPSEAHFYTITIKDSVARLIKITIEEETSIIFYPQCGMNMKTPKGLEEFSEVIQELYNEYEDLCL